MTSKEALENIIKFLQDLEDNSLIPAFTEYLKEIKVINKDLEVLEIIKKNKKVIFSKRPNYDGVSSDDFFAIREWLENEKNN